MVASRMPAGPRLGTGVWVLLGVERDLCVNLKAHLCADARTLRAVC